MAAAGRDEPADAQQHTTGGDELRSSHDELLGPGRCCGALDGEPASSTLVANQGLTCLLLPCTQVTLTLTLTLTLALALALSLALALALAPAPTPTPTLTLTLTCLPLPCTQAAFVCAHSHTRQHRRSRRLSNPPAPTPPPPPPREAPPFSELQVDGLLGEGGGSKVLLVRHAVSDSAGTRSDTPSGTPIPSGGTSGSEPSEFALKCLSKRLLAARGTALHAVRERRALQACDHPFVCRYVAAYQEGEAALTLTRTRTRTRTRTLTL
jgi:hypothetical protein